MHRGLSHRLAVGAGTLDGSRHNGSVVHRQALRYALIDEHFPRFLERLEADRVSLPHFVKEEFEAYLKCGCLEYGFLRVKCDTCRHEKLVGFSCNRRGSCPSCGTRRMAETAAHLVEHVPPEQPIRTDIEPVNDHTDTLTTTSIDGLFYLSFKHRYTHLS